MDFDPTSSYPSAMWDEKSVYVQIETGYAFTPDKSDEIFENFKTQTFKESSAILKVVKYNTSDLTFQHLPVRDKVKKTEINRMRAGYIIHISTSIDIKEIVKLGGKSKKNLRSCYLQ